MSGTRRVGVVVGVAAGLMFGAVWPVGADPEQPAGDDARSGQVVVVAGRGAAGFSGDGGPAREARIVARQISVGRDGSVYLSDEERVRRVTPDGVIDTVFSARRDATVDDEKLTAAAVAPDGSLYVTSEVDYSQRQLLRVARNGAVTVLAGQSKLGAAAEEAGFDVDDVAVDGAGNAYLYDATHKRVVRVDPAGRVARIGKGTISLTGAPQLAVGPTGAVYLTAGTGPDRSDGGSVFGLDAAGSWREVAASGERPPAGPAVAADGTVYFVDQGRRQIMRIDEDGSSVPVSVRLDGIGSDLAIGPDGDLYVTYGTDSATEPAQVLELVRHGTSNPDASQKPGRSAWADDAPGTVHTIAGTGRRPPKAGPRSARYGEQDENIGDIAVGGDGTVYVAEPARHQVRAIAPDGTARRFAGTGATEKTIGDYTDDRADAVVLNRPTAVATAPDGTVYIVANARLYKVDKAGKISAIDVPPQNTDGAGQLDVPRLVATDTAGTLYYADYDTIQKLAPDGRPVVVVGATPGPELVDAPPAREFLLGRPRWFSVGADGSVYFTQWDTNAVQAARPNGDLDTVLEGPGFAGDGGPATRALTNHPSGGAVGRDGSRYIADTYNNRIRRVDARGTVTTVAGTGRYADTGDDGPATKAALTEPTDVDVGPDRTLYVLTSSDKVRAIGPNGTIRTLADLDPEPSHKATDTTFNGLDSFTVGADGTVYLASASGVHSTKPGGELRPVALDMPLSAFAKYGPTSPPRSASLATGPDGSLYLVPNAALRAFPDGAVVPLLGGGMDNRMADQPPESWSTSVEYTFREGDPRDIEIGPDGTVYLSTQHGLYSLSPDGRLDTLLKAREYDLFGRIALDPDGRLYLLDDLNRVDRVVGSRREKVATIDDAEDDSSYDRDLAFTSDGTMFVSTGREIRRFSSDGATAVVYQGDKGDVTKLDVGPNDDLYFLEGATQVRVLVKAAQAPELSSLSSTSRTILWSIGGGVIVLVSSFLIIRRANRRNPEGQPTKP